MGEITEKNLEKARKKVKNGRGLMKFGCVLFFINATIDFALFFFCLSYFFWAKDSMIYEVIGGIMAALWSSPMTIAEMIMRPFLAIFLVLAGIGGLSWIKNKGPLMSLAPMMAMISAVIIVANLFLDIRRLVISNWNWGQFIWDIISLQLTCGIYFIGWMLAKGDPDE